MKKKIFYCITAVFSLLFIIIAALPLMIESKKVQQEILQRIEQSYIVDAEVASVELSFFPAPHIDLYSLSVLHKDFNLTIPETTIYPSWKILIGQPEIGRVSIIQPQFTLLNNSVALQNSNIKPPEISLDSLPNVTVVISDGSLKLPSFITELGTINQTSFTEVRAKITLRNSNIAFTWDSLPNFGEDLDFEALISLTDFNSHGQVVFNHLDLSKLYRTSKLSPLAFITDTSDFSTNFQYSPNKGFSLKFDGDIPDFTLKSPDLGDRPPVPVRINEGKIEISSAKDFFEVKIESLEVSEPALKLHGDWSYDLPSGQNKKQVKIDLQGEDIDATTLRKKVLALVGSNIVAETVCDIVQNGYANSASYRFNGTIADFEDINAMTLDVDIDRADIHLKYVPIDLENARGKIRIKDGDLTGWDITTEVKDSLGTNGSFLVGLAANNWGLNVDVDINCNLSQLPPILREIITDQDVVEELHLVTASGRGDAHLHIGEDLNDFKVIVDVTSYDNPVIRYERISWPITPHKGQLQVTDTDANWSNLSLTLGNHIIRESSGHISWDEPSTPFELTSLTGIFDNNTMLSELKKFAPLRENLDSVATSVVGSTKLVGRLKGHFFAPEDYTYDFIANLKDVTISTPLFPEDISLAEAQANVSDTTITISETSGLILANTMKIQGDLSHDDWMSWHGDLIFDGDLHPPLLKWLIQQELIPANLKLKTPTALSTLQIKWSEDDVLIKGQIHPLDTATTLDLQISVTPEIVAGDLNIAHRDSNSEIRFSIEPTKDNYDFYINGLLPGQALSNLIEDSFIKFNTISGKMNIHANFPEHDAPPQIDFGGNLEVSKINILINNKRSAQHTLSFAVTGEDSNLTINKFDFNFNKEVLYAQGEFKHEGWDGYLHLNIKSPTVNTDTIEQITDNINTFVYDRLGIDKNSTDHTSKYNLNSTINFNFENFIVPFGEEKNNEVDDKKYHFPISPLQGQYVFNNTNSSLKIRESKVCGLEIEAFLTWLGEKETQKEVSVQTPTNESVELSEFLECFKLNAVIEGPLTMKAQGISQTGQVKQGYFSFSSEKGTIYKFAAVAKAISILNIKGWSGSIWQKGFYYNKLELSGFIENNLLQIHQFLIDGDGVDLIGTGTFNLDTMEYDMVFYVVPFASVGSFVTKVPIVGRVLGGKEGRIISVPVKVTGPAGDPEVSIMDASAMGKATQQWIWETVIFPFDWMPDEGEKKETAEEDHLNVEERATIPQQEDSFNIEKQPTTPPQEDSINIEEHATIPQGN